jgi:hypothetical protein
MTDSPKQVNLDQFESLDAAVAAVQGPVRRYDVVAKRLGDAQGIEQTRLGYLFLSAVARARGLHEGIAQAIAASNPHATFPLLRQFAETVLVVMYVAENPEYAGAIIVHPRHEPTVRRKNMQELIDWSKRRRHAEQFKEVYAELCEGTHYGSTAWGFPFDFAEDRAADSPSWRSSPRWTSKRQALTACAWTLEIAEAMESALNNLAGRCLREQRAATAREAGVQVATCRVHGPIVVGDANHTICPVQSKRVVDDEEVVSTCAEPLKVERPHRTAE